MRGASSVAVVATFTAMVVGTDFVLSPMYNVKLLDTLVFVSAYLFGLRVGAAVGILSESIWSFASPVGMAGPIAPVLVAGEVMFAVAGWGAAKVWGRSLRPVSPYSVAIGASMAVCAFLWDLLTNLATAQLAFWPSPTLFQYLAYSFGPMTIPFILAHEGSDFIFGMLLAPTFIFLVPKVYRGPA